MRIVLQNLLGNAFKFTSRHATARIELGIRELDGQLTYFVNDDGAGFDMVYGAKLFGAFERLHSEHEFEGSGIGLALVQRIIHRHGGRIWAESAVEQGTTIFFTLGSQADIHI
jgi:light-regulated signal transduction histidine kinase (bacteriophytochrome)